MGSVGRTGIKPGLSKLLVFGLGVCSVASGCLTSDLSKEDPPSVVMELGRPEEHPAPLPARIPIREKIYQAGKLVSERVVFVGWDFNRDGQLDMLEVLDSRGKVRERIYDFNLDGKPDLNLTVKDGLPQPPLDSVSKGPVGQSGPWSGR